METLSTGATPVKVERDIERVYRSVNGAWPKDVPPLTYREAVSAARRLWRHFCKRRFPWEFVETSGNRGNNLRRSDWKFQINPAWGWSQLVHSVSHYAFSRLNPGLRPHDARHAYLERNMIEHVVAKGWLSGSLKKPEKPKEERDVKAIRKALVVARLAAWERKKKRAETAIKKLRAKVKYYERSAP